MLRIQRSDEQPVVDIPAAVEAEGPEAIEAYVTAVLAGSIVPTASTSTE